MKSLSLCALFALASCSSVPKPQLEVQNDIIMNHMGQGKKIIGKDFEEKFSQDGLINGEYVAIGSIRATYITNEKTMIAMASHDAKSTLLESAPSEYKKVVQNALSYVNNDNGSQDSVSIMVTEAKALTGIKVNFSDVQCVVYAQPKVDVSYDYIRECRAIARVPASNLATAYNYTMSKKYKVEDQTKLREIMSKQLMGVMLSDNDSAPEPAVPAQAPAVAPVAKQ
jgi:hypothetical protein